MNLCPCKYPLNTLMYGVIINENDIAFMTRLMSFLLVASIPFMKNCANVSEKINSIRKDSTENVSIIFFPTLNVLSFASYLSSARYSLIIILIAIGIPAVDMFRNKLYIL